MQNMHSYMRAQADIPGQAKQLSLRVRSAGQVPQGTFS
jgi:hypothetical protein